MGKLLKFETERWIEVFNESGVQVRLSTRGNVDFVVTDADTGEEAYSNTLKTEQLLRLAQNLTQAFTD